MRRETCGVCFFLNVFFFFLTDFKYGLFEVFFFKIGLFEVGFSFAVFEQPIFECGVTPMSPSCKDLAGAPVARLPGDGRFRSQAVLL